MDKNVQFYKEITVILWCDNEVAVNKKEQLEGRIPCSMCDSNEQDYYSITKLRVINSKLPKGIQCQ